MSVEAYFFGRTPAPLQPPYEGKEHILGNQRLDGSVLSDLAYEHCTFANLSFKDAQLENGRFVNCAFVSCYFRRTAVQNCNFASCRFVNCEFPDASFSACDFRYTRFSGCYIDFEELEHNLPAEPNLRGQLSHNLAREAALLGEARTAREYRLCEVQAREAHYWAVIFGRSKWYREHFDYIARLKMSLRLAGSKFNGWIFGYGEKLWILVRNYLVATLGVFPALFYSVRNGLRLGTEGMSRGNVGDFASALEFSLDNAVAGAFGSPIEAIGLMARAIAAIQIVFAAIWAGVTAGYLFRWSILR